EFRTFGFGHRLDARWSPHRGTADSFRDAPRLVVLGEHVHREGEEAGQDRAPLLVVGRCPTEDRVVVEGLRQRRDDSVAVARAALAGYGGDRLDAHGLLLTRWAATREWVTAGSLPRAPDRRTSAH